MYEVREERYIIEMVGNTYPFYVSDVMNGGEPCFTADVDGAIKYRSQARALIELERIKKAGFAMDMVVEPLVINYTIGRNAR